MTKLAVQPALQISPIKSSRSDCGREKLSVVYNNRGFVPLPSGSLVLLSTDPE